MVKRGELVLLRLNLLAQCRQFGGQLFTRLTQVVRLLLELLEARLSGGRIGFQLLAARVNIGESIGRVTEASFGFRCHAHYGSGVGVCSCQCDQFRLEPFDSSRDFSPLSICFEQDAVGILETLAGLCNIGFGLSPLCLQRVHCRLGLSLLFEPLFPICNCWFQNFLPLDQRPEIGLERRQFCALLDGFSLNLVGPPLRVFKTTQLHDEHR